MKLTFAMAIPFGGTVGKVCLLPCVIVGHPMGDHIIADHMLTAFTFFGPIQCHNEYLCVLEYTCKQQLFTKSFDIPLVK